MNPLIEEYFPRNDTFDGQDVPSSCFFVFVGGKYVSDFNRVLEKVENISEDLFRFRPVAFISSTMPTQFQIESLKVV